MLLLIAGAGGIAGTFMYGTVIHTNHRLGAVAPEMSRRNKFAFFLRESLLLCRANIHGLGPQMFTVSSIHDLAFQFDQGATDKRVRHRDFICIVCQWFCVGQNYVRGL